ncbi:restriction endonuclease [Anaeromassilibacillus senegalensis]|uniref:restriction endonuclease n=1 Tax=Anaeromassilibacillus senegalensis TaxID=1673717 RepID=UPI000680121C|nr:restriction endonuclease [Anaeromassilibacillus senegalensis]
MSNTGKLFEDLVYNIVVSQVNKGQFLLSDPNVRVCRNAKYYSKDREANIECEISVEKYLIDPSTNTDVRPSIIVIIECKDYSGPIPVSDVEEFHAKLQQIGADNTKGIIIIRSGYYQKSALKYALSKGITLARIMPENQVSYILYRRANSFSNVLGASMFRALTEPGFCSDDGEEFFSLSGEKCLCSLIDNLIK